MASSFSALMPSGFEAHEQVAPDAESWSWSSAGHAEQRADEHGRDLGREVLDVVEAGAVALRVEEQRSTALGCDSPGDDAAGGEGPADQSPELVVAGGSMKIIIP